MTAPSTLTKRGALRPDAATTDASRRLRCGAVALAIAVGASVAHAAPPRDPPMPEYCAVPDDIAFADAPLPRLARKLKANELVTLVVIGSGSAAGSGTSGKDAAFPQRFEARFAEAFGRPRTRLAVFAEPGQTAAGMFDRLNRDVLPLKPAIVVWQTGSADAARGIPVMEFGATLERGVALLRNRGIETVLVDSQFSPRASLLVNTDAYREAVRWNARRYDVPLFKRYDTMQYWWSHETFDLDTDAKAVQVRNADRIHDCVAALLVRMIDRGLKSGTARP